MQTDCNTKSRREAISEEEGKSRRVNIARLRSHLGLSMFTARNNAEYLPWGWLDVTKWLYGLHWTITRVFFQ